jgi:hypothetical protein
MELREAIEQSAVTLSGSPAEAGAHAQEEAEVHSNDIRTCHPPEDRLDA